MSFNPHVSVFTSATERLPDVDLAIDVVLEKIAGGAYAEKIAELRKLTAGENAYREAKKKLPAFTASGTFAVRNAGKIIAHSGILQIDIDIKDNVGFEPEPWKHLLKKDPHICAAFTSPGGEGLKILVRIPADPEKHAENFKLAEAYFKNNYNLTADPAAKDLARLCFASHDPDLYKNKNATPLTKQTSHRHSAPPREPINTLDRARAYLAACPPAVQGQRGHASLLWAARAMVEGFLLSDGDALALLEGEFNPRCSPPWDLADPKQARDFRRKIPEVRKTPGKHAPGWLLAGNAPTPSPSASPPAPATMLPTGEIVTSTVPEKPAEEPLRICTYDELLETDAKPPAELIQGCLYLGDKAMFAAPSKRGKTFLALNLAVAVSTGTPWLGMPTLAMPTLYLNLELKEHAYWSRCRQMVTQQLASNVKPTNLHTIFGRGKGVDFIKLADAVKRFQQIAEAPGLLIVDPWYKLSQGIVDENKATDVGRILNEFEALSEATGVTTLFIHHYAKGNASAKNSEDRASGSGVFARDADTLLTFTDHAEDNCMTVESTLRNFKSLPPFVIRFNYPVWERDPLLDPADLRRETKRKTAGSAAPDRGRPGFDAQKLQAALAEIGDDLVTSANVGKLQDLTGWGASTIYRKWADLRSRQ